MSDWYTVNKEPERSDWTCELFGPGYRFTPIRGQEPNWFHRWMQFIVLGFRWRKRNDGA